VGDWAWHTPKKTIAHRGGLLQETAIARRGGLLQETAIARRGGFLQKSDPLHVVHVERLQRCGMSLTE
jgi:hypothetical protein